MNKTYIKVALALLSIAGYMQNVIFASETAENSCMEKSRYHHMISSAIFDQYQDEALDDMDEALLAIHYADDAKNLLVKLSEVDVHDYSTYSTENEHKIYNKKIENMDIGRLDFTIPSSSKYPEVYRQYWDFKYEKNIDEKIINGKVARLYCKNTVLFEKHNPDPNYTPLTKKYTLASRIYLQDLTVIICPSRTLNYDGEVNQTIELKEVYENQKPIELDIDPEEALNKLADNLAGFVIKKGGDDQVHVTYINAIYDSGNSTETTQNIRQRAHEYTKILKLAQRIISNETSTLSN
ncbi:fam-a protein [Plasmodium vinckei brucechwatti]|uniref:Fam-a protein n=1 Tax=Plasmodium vinckei brucechwatti TaxID=119398 RepID=A0A6V7SN76_PLAVN|nr:fam-a protein [Plasmodium vinckei brucechwatti]